MSGIPDAYPVSRGFWDALLVAKDAKVPAADLGELLGISATRVYGIEAEHKKRIQQKAS